MLYGISSGSDVARVGGRAGTASLRVQMGESMRQYIPVITLAVIAALALAVVSGRVAPVGQCGPRGTRSDAPQNTMPVFASGGNQRSIAENYACQASTSGPPSSATWTMLDGNTC